MSIYKSLNSSKHSKIDEFVLLKIYLKKYFHCVLSRPCFIMDHPLPQYIGFSTIRNMCLKMKMLHDCLCRYRPYETDDSMIFGILKVLIPVPKKGLAF